MKIQGSCNTTAAFRVSNTSPWLEAPSPVKATATLPLSASLQASAAPATGGTPPPTIPFAPSMPLEKSAICMEPPLPPQSPVFLA